MQKKEIIVLVLLIVEVHFKNVKCGSNKNNLNTNKQYQVPSSTMNKKIQRHSHTLIEEFTSKNVSRKSGRIHTNTSILHSLKTEDSGPCPKGFTAYNTGTGSDLFCYIFTEPQPFPPACPYPNYLSASTYNKQELLQNEIWVTAMRNTSDGFGPFERIEHDNRYGESITSYEVESKNITQKNCLTRKKNNYKPVSCNDHYPALCIYPYDSKSISRYCQKHYGNSNGYGNCISDSINIEKGRCYCERIQTEVTQKHQREIQGTRNSFCDALAEPLLSFQNQLLVTQLQTTKDVCWFGLYKDKDETPKWTISDVKINYTNWIADTDFSKPFGAIQYVDYRGWVLADDDGTIECGICELENVYNKNVSIRLKYNPLKNKIELRVTNALELSDLFADHYALYCFVGPTTTQFKQSLTKYYDFKSIQVESGDFIDDISIRWPYATYYWCDGFQHPKFTKIYSKKLLIQNQNGEQEYAIQVTVRTKENRDPYLDTVYEDAVIYILMNVKEITFKDILRAMKVLKFDQENSFIEMVIHLTMAKVENETLEYEKLEKSLKTLPSGTSSPILNITRFGRSDVCLPSRHISGKKTLSWPKTPTGTVTLPTEPCLQENGDPVMRTCEGDFLQGAFWSEVIGNCTDDVDLSERAQELHDLLNNENITANELSGNLSQITEDNSDVTMMDIYLITEVLEKLETFGNVVNVSDAVTIISNIMNFESSKLRKAQEILNSTDKMLYSFDNILTNVKDHQENSYNVITSKRALVQISDVRTTNITGLALHGNSEENNFDSFKLIPIYKNTSLQKLPEDNIELVAFLPSKMLLEIENCLKPEDPIHLVMVLFYNDALFNENVTDTRQTNSRIISILIPGFHCIFRTPIPIIFKPLHNTDFEKKCVHWNYGLDNNMENNIQGIWSENGIPKTNIINNTHVICEFDHVTHFALLMMGSLTKQEPSEGHTKALDIITAIGTILSLTSILVMILMAIIFKNWRRNRSNKIILNLCVAVALQLSLLYAANNIKSDGIWCVVTGASLHYTLLSEFCWMLVIAILQYRKFVIVFQNHIPHFVAKACAFCWLFPFIPIAILLAVSNNSYKKNQYGLCYPSGKFFYFGIVLPICTIWFFNFFIFIKIIFSVCRCRKKIKAYGSNQDDSKLQILLALFLFFTLGISWIFGVAVSFGAGILFSYLFCVTATLQGFAMFVFFVVAKGRSRRLWMNAKRTFTRKNQNERPSNSSCSPIEYSGRTELSSAFH